MHPEKTVTCLKHNLYLNSVEIRNIGLTKFVSVVPIQARDYN